jgi:hypothetical protein
MTDSLFVEEESIVLVGERCRRERPRTGVPRAVWFEWTVRVSGTEKIFTDQDDSAPGRARHTERQSPDH